MNILKILTIFVLLLFIASCGGGGGGTTTNNNNQTTCTYTSWTPETNTVQMNVNFIQTSNCNNIRNAVGTMLDNTSNISVATISFNATQSINLNLLKTQITQTFSVFNIIASPSLGTIILADTTITYLSQKYGITDTFSIDTIDDGLANANIIVSIVINNGDPLYQYQWYIVNQRSDILGDINAKETLAKGYSGKGVKVAVVDTPVNTNHEDLTVAETYNPSSHGVGAHGTGVAGIIVARGYNNIGIRGIAYEVSLHSYARDTGGIAYWEKITGSSTINPNSKQVDIFNFSFPASSQGANTNEYGDVLRYSTIYGRDGRGVIYVAAAGNYGNFDAVQVNNSTWRQYPINVSAISPLTNQKISYSSVGSGLWLTTYSNPNPGIYGVVNTNGLASTGVGNSEYVSFGGTSGAAPVVSAAIALILEANASLTWRDVRYILATTTRMIHQDIPPATTLIASITYETRQAWTTNSAGYAFHEWYGFGSLDVDKAVSLAESYATNSYSVLNNANYIDLSINNTWHSSETLNPNIAIAPFTAISRTLSVVDSISIESLEVFFSIDPSSYGIKLTSPSGTTAIIVPLGNGSANKQVNVNNFFRENSAGSWTIEIINNNASNTNEALISWGVRFFGVDTSF